jgi:hydrogenase small subunit
MNVSRRDFLKYCVCSAAALGLEGPVLSSLTKALAAGGSGLTRVLWLSAAGCTGCTVSLANRISASGPVDIADLLINYISLEFHPVLMAGAGERAAKNILDGARGPYVLAVEGGIPTAFDGHACSLFTTGEREVTALRAVKYLAAHSIANLSIGTCASFGGMSAAAPNPTGVTSLRTASGRSTINIPGCPPHPDWVVWTIAQLLAGSVPALDSQGRPTALYGSTVHSRCPRREAGDSSTFGQEGRCLEELGCKGPDTRADCPVRKWNNAANWCVGANAECIGCTESGFPDSFSPFYGGGD